MSERLSQTDYAAMREKSRQAVHKHVASGRLPVDADGLIDPEQADELLGWSPPEGSGEADYYRARARREEASASLKELELAQKQGQVCLASDVESLAFGVGREFRDDLLQSTTRLRSRGISRELEVALEEDLRGVLERAEERERAKVEGFVEGLGVGGE